MPLTNAEKQKKWREKKAEEVGHKEVRNKDNERRRLKRTKIKKNKFEEEMFKKKQAERKKKSRELNKFVKLQDADNEPSVSPEFSSYASKKRSISRAERALPVDKKQRIEVVQHLFETTIEANHHQKILISRLINTSEEKAPCIKTGRPPKISKEKAEKLKNFLQNTDVSYILPGKNNQFYIGKADGQKIFKPKKYLIYTYHQLHSLLQKNEDIDLASIKFSTMYRFIRDSKEYIGFFKTPHVTCLCPTCENVELLVNGINNALAINTNYEKFPEHCHELINMISCEPITKLCSENSCPNCPFREETCDFLKDTELI